MVFKYSIDRRHGHRNHLGNHIVEMVTCSIRYRCLMEFKTRLLRLEMIVEGVEGNGRTILRLMFPCDLIYGSNKNCFVEQL